MPCSIFSFILCNALPNIYNLRLYPRKTKGKLWISTFQPVLTVWLKIIVKIFFYLFSTWWIHKSWRLELQNFLMQKQNIKKRLVELSYLVKGQIISKGLFGILNRPVYIYWESVLFPGTIMKWDYFSQFSDWYFVTIIVLTYCEKKLF